LGHSVGIKKLDASIEERLLAELGIKEGNQTEAHGGSAARGCCTKKELDLGKAPGKG